jgi:peptide deformylase
MSNNHPDDLLRITFYGESVLTTKGQPVTVFDDELEEFAETMLDTMYEANGIGLAAQQVDRAIMLCVLDVAPDEGRPDYDYLLDGKKPPIDLIMPMALVNPDIVFFSDTQEDFEEGCLSFPDIRGDVRRPIAIRVKFQDLGGNPHELTCDGIFARCIQHEVDHLNGVLFIDRMSPSTVAGIKGAITNLKKRTRRNLKKTSE